MRRARSHRAAREVMPYGAPGARRTAAREVSGSGRTAGARGGVACRAAGDGRG
ncbi:hypothetical protein [Bailinhaonella thermotolerans]|uniref:hypothetical protein n=1 Tax=Bailinhaonella thermotolerans TaxID=1070861 RepID=UPI00192A38A6|nr:hypothetical protein [Bailinhaonella thermotolerans]